MKKSIKWIIKNIIRMMEKKLKIGLKNMIICKRKLRMLQNRGWRWIIQHCGVFKTILNPSTEHEKKIEIIKKIYNSYNSVLVRVNRCNTLI